MYTGRTDDPVLSSCPPKRSRLTSLNTPYSTCVTMNCPMSVAEQSSEIKIGRLFGDSRQNNECVERTYNSTEFLEKYFMSGSLLSPVELLVYSLMKIQFKTSTFTKHHSISQYQGITDVVSRICGVQFEPNALRRLFPRISHNQLKSTVGKENGKVRWSYFSKQVDELIRISGEEIERIIHTDGALQEDQIVQINDQLKRICCTSKESSEKLTPENFFYQFNNNIKTRLSGSSKWIPWYNAPEREICLFSFGSSPGYAEKELRLSRTFEWKLFLKAIERDLSNCDKIRDFPRSIGTVELLVELLNILDNCKICDGCGEAEKYNALREDSGENLFRRKDGKNAVLIENDKARSTSCHLLVPQSVTNCPMCVKCRHYFRTLMSRRKSEKNAKQPEKARLDYKSKPELLDIARQSATVIKQLTTKNKRLELAVENMVELGPNSNDDLQGIFNNLYIGLQNNRDKHKNPICLWEACLQTDKFEECTVTALKELLDFICSWEFKEKYGDDLYINVKRISQDHVESYFSAQRQMCGGTQNMTGYSYGYNVNCLSNISSSKILMKKQTNVYNIAEALPVLNNSEQLPKRRSKDNEGIWDSIPWFIEVE
ncbi:Hypothetical predicted protein [Paramuricea clavata]|uniref:Uncharacterized protein n=1 Tax=Paramuricea clavata TaxID=317549 RepID=A0A6S7HYS8_PARCT|nr:Hypothetical predicted protein [Paramuricea clavata]